MTIDKAIQLLSDHAHRGITTFNQDSKDATKLGIEALKAVQKFQRMGSKINPLRLPGETE